MAITKYAKAEILDVRGSEERVKTASLDKFADFDNYRTEDGYLYARIRAISSRVNKNHDGWPSVELAGSQDIFDHHTAAEGGFTVEASEDAEYGFSTFLGKPIFVDHNNHDPDRARGVVVDSKLHVEDYKTATELDPYYSNAPSEHTPPTWVELLLEVDAKSFPHLAAAIVEGSKDASNGIDGFSMGCDVEKSVCNICKNAATSPDEYCEHVRLKGAHFDVLDEKTGQKTSRKSYEDCYGVKFFEISAVFDPADETALLRELIHKEGTTKEDYSSGKYCEQNGHSSGSDGRCVYCGEEVSENLTEKEGSFFESLGAELNEAATEGSNDGIDTTFLTGDEPAKPLQKQASTEETERKAYEMLKAANKPIPADLQKYAENPLPQSELLHSPDDLDTLRNETICPVCGSSMDDETCEICGYIEPPEGFKNPDLEKHQQQDELPDPGFEPTPIEEGITNAQPTPGPGGMSQPDVLQGSNPGMTARVKTEMADWNISVHPKIAGRINVTEKPITTSNDEQTNEPDEQIINDEPKPVTSSVRTAKDFIAAAEQRKQENMSNKQKTAAEPVPAAKPDKRVDVDGTGGVDQASNEEASKADAQVGVVEQGGTGVEDVSADQEGVNVDQGDEHSKNIEGTKTDTWGDDGRQTSPVGGDTFPSENGQGAGGWTSHQRTALDDGPYPSEDGGLAGGSANQGTQPVDPAGKADDRVDVLKPVTSPSNNSGPTDTWSGTDGNAVTRQQDPVTNEDLEGEDIVNLSPSKSSSHIFAAVKLADLEEEIGLIDGDEKYERMAELEAQSPEVVEASLAYVEKIKGKVATIRQTKQASAKRLPQFSAGVLAPRTAATASESVSDEEIGDSSLFLS